MKKCLTCGTINKDEVQECIKCTGISFGPVNETGPELAKKKK